MVKKPGAASTETYPGSPPAAPEVAANEQEDNDLLRTGQVLQRAQISHQVLYRYVTLGLIEPAVVSESGLRLFHPNVISLIAIIKSLNRSGYSLQQMKEIFFKDTRVKRVLADSAARSLPQKEQLGRTTRST